MKTMMKMFLIAITLMHFSARTADAQQWMEFTGTKWDFDLSGKKILTVIYESFNYEEAIEITNYWKQWGAKVDLAGTLPEQHGERNNPATGKVHDEVPVTVTPELLLEDADFNSYDLVYFPGGEGVDEFLKSYRDKLKEIIDGRISNQKYVAAICHAPYILTASNLLSGRTITVQGNEYKPAILKAGAKIVNEVFVCDGSFLTGQWPYFETFAVSVAEKLVSPYGVGPVVQTRRNSDKELNELFCRRNTLFMKPGTISNDTLELMIRYSLNPVLPFDMMNNPVTRFVVVKDSSVRSALVDKIIEYSLEKIKAEKKSPDAMRGIWTKIFNAPALIFVFNDLTAAASMNDEKDKENFIKITNALAGQSVSQLGFVAREMGYGISIIGSLRSMRADQGFLTVLGVPSGYQLVNIIGIGHPAEEMGPPVARPLSEYLVIK